MHTGLDRAEGAGHDLQSDELTDLCDPWSVCGATVAQVLVDGVNQARLHDEEGHKEGDEPG